MTATAGSTDAVATGVSIAAGSSQSFTVTANFLSYASGNVKVSFDLGSVGVASNTFDGKAPA